MSTSFAAAVSAAFTVDVRVVVATHRDLEKLSEAGEFRRDLYHHVVVFPVTLPPLRKRSEDLPALVEHFSQQICAQNGWKPVTFSTEAMDSLRKFSWPGNIRELRNIVERLLLFAESNVGIDEVRLVLPGASSSSDASSSVKTAEGRLADRVLAFERGVVLAELARNHRQITQTARALGLERSHLYKKCQQLGIDLFNLPPG